VLGFLGGLELGSVWRLSEERRDLEHSARRRLRGLIVTHFWGVECGGGFGMRFAL
jgi:hypothetical protein